MAALVANNASSTLVGGLTIGATTLTVLDNTGAVFPDVAAADSNWFLVTIINGDGLSEIVKCTARNADELTIERGQEDTDPLLFADEDKVELRLTAGVINSFSTEAGPDGDSAYLVAVANGFDSNEADWLTSLVSTVEGPAAATYSVSGGVLTITTPT